MGQLFLHDCKILYMIELWCGILLNIPFKLQDIVNLYSKEFSLMFANSE